MNTHIRALAAGWWLEVSHDTCPQLEIARRNSRRIILVKSMGMGNILSGTQSPWLPPWLVVYLKS